MIVFLLAFVLAFLFCAIGGWIAYQTFNSDTTEQAEGDVSDYQYLRLAGAVDKYPITMEIHIDGSNAWGTYYYNRKGPDNVLTLNGTMSNDGRLYLDEYDENGVRTGCFSGTLSEGQYEGEFVKTNGKGMHFLVK